MHIAIDDTYGPTDAIPTKYVTGARRTYVAVEFPDSEVVEVRDGIVECLAGLSRIMGIAPTEFHFVEVYNRIGQWKSGPAGANLGLFEFFAEIYRRYRWRVHVQTVDERTFADHGSDPTGTADDIDLGTREGQALLLLLAKLKLTIPPPPEKLIVRIDEGHRKPGAVFAEKIFREWDGVYDGKYASSSVEPLLQIADFLAFSINRCTHLQLKPLPTDTDLWFLNLIGTMNINSSDLMRRAGSGNDLRADLDAGHLQDRIHKGLE